MDVTINRHKFIGGSDVAAILGLSKYRSAYEVWDEKRNGSKTFSGNAATEWGHILEPVILDFYQQKNNLVIENRNDRFYSKDYDFLGCHPDGISGEVLFEVKTVSSKAYWNWQNEIPLEYYCQIQHNMFVCNLKKARFLIFVLDDRNLIEIDVKFDEEYVSKQNEYLIKWWQDHMIEGIAPVMTVNDFEKLSDLAEKTIEANDEGVKIYEELSSIKAKIKELDEQKTKLEESLKMQLGDGTILMKGLQTLATWKPQTKVSMDTKKFKEEQPEMFVKYAKEQSFRTFLLKTKKQ